MLVSVDHDFFMIVIQRPRCKSVQEVSAQLAKDDPDNLFQRVGKRFFLAAALLYLMIPALAQSQYGYKSFIIENAVFGSTKNEYILRDGVITHKIYYNNELNATNTYHCRTDIDGQDVLEVFAGIHNTQRMFIELRKISYDDESSTISHIIKKAMAYGEDAIRAYKKGGCKSRSQELEEMYDELDKIQKKSDRGEMIRGLELILRQYRSLNTSSPCGYVY